MLRVHSLLSPLSGSLTPVSVLFLRFRALTRALLGALLLIKLWTRPKREIDAIIRAFNVTESRAQPPTSINADNSPPPNIHYMASYSYRLAPNETWGKGSVEIGPPAQPGESRIRRLEKTHDRLVTAPVEGISTVHDILLYAARTHGTRRAFGYRDVLDIVEEQKEVTKTVGGQQVKETKTWKYFQLSDYKYINFVELKDIVSEVARGLLKLGMQKNDVFNIYAQTRWVTRFSHNSSPPIIPFFSPDPPLRFLLSCLSEFLSHTTQLLTQRNDGVLCTSDTAMGRSRLCAQFLRVRGARCLFWDTSQTETAAMQFSSPGCLVSPR
jgi:hypothetical protein